MRIYHTSNDEYPENGEHVLVQNKHAWIEAYFDSSDNTFGIYMWNSISFYGEAWIKFKDFESLIKTVENESNR